MKIVIEKVGERFIVETIEVHPLIGKKKEIALNFEELFKTIRNLFNELSK